MTITLITGGARSGKSTHALERAAVYESKVFIATAVAFDAEMKARIDKHRADRAPSFKTIEAPHDLDAAVRGLPAGTAVAVIDCLTVWLGNLMHKHGEDQKEFAEVGAFLEALPAVSCDVILVTNEVGMGVVPENAAARRFRDLAGTLNQRVAAMADEVIFMVSGQAMQAKGRPRGGRM